MKWTAYFFLFNSLNDSKRTFYQVVLEILRLEYQFFFIYVTYVAVLFLQSMNHDYFGGALLIAIDWNAKIYVRW